VVLVIPAQGLPSRRRGRESRLPIVDFPSFPRRRESSEARYTHAVKRRPLRILLCLILLTGGAVTTVAVA
jgi:hypothetical protein